MTESARRQISLLCSKASLFGDSFGTLEGTRSETLGLGHQPSDGAPEKSRVISVTVSTHCSTCQG